MERCSNIPAIKIKVTIEFYCLPINSVNLKFKISVSFDLVNSFLGVGPVEIKVLVCRDTRTRMWQHYWSWKKKETR